MYLKRDPKTGVYKYRREYPADVREILGKINFIRSLHTKELKKANIASTEAEKEYNAVLKNAHTQGRMPVAERRELVAYLKSCNLLPDSAQDIDLSTVQRLLSNTYNAMIAQAEDSVKSGRAKEKYNRLEREAPQIVTAYRRLRECERKFLQRTGIPESVDILRALHKQPSELRGEKLFDSIVATIQTMYPLPATADPVNASKSSVKLQHVHEKWLELKKPSYRQKLHMEKIVALLKAWCGDRAVATYTEEEISEFVEAWGKIPLKLPAHVKAFSLRDQLAWVKGQKDHGPVREPQTVKNMVNTLKAFFNIAIKKLKVPMENPAQGIEINMSGKRKSRHPYSPEKLKLLFHSPVYAGCKSARLRSDPGSLIIRDEKFWLPLLGLYSGCRLDELGQLTVSDIRSTASGIAYLSINRDHDHKHLKNAAAEREVPLHQELIRCGFMEYHKQRKSDKDAIMLFPNLSQSPDGRFTKAFSQWYSRYCQDIGLKDDRKLVFHSFRHGFKDVCREAGIPKDVHDKLTGHTSSADVGDGYGLGYTLPKLNEHLQRLRYDGLDLSHLHVAARKTPATIIGKGRVFKLKRRVTSG